MLSARDRQLKQVKEREDEDPNQVDEVPEESGHLDAIGKMLRVFPVEPGARTPEEGENQDSTENVQAMQAGDHEIRGEIGAVLGSERTPVIDIGRFDLYRLCIVIRCLRN